MTTSLPDTRTSTFLAALAVALLCLSAVTAAPAGAAPLLQTASGVTLRTLPLPAGVPVLSASAHTRGSASADGTIIDTGARFTVLGVLCDAPRNPGVVVQLRTSLNRADWSRWYEVALEQGAESGAAARPVGFTEALWTGEGRYVQVAAVQADAETPPALRNVRIVAIDSSAGVLVPPAVRGFGVGANGSFAAARGAAGVSRPALVSRAEWGADESIRKADPSFAPVRMAFIHHTDGGNTYTAEQAPGLVRAIYAYHVESMGWNDIGYNFLVDRFGTIYEGRYGGVSDGVIGAQTYGFNTGSTGISVIGTYVKEAPPAAAMAALRRLLAWKLSLTDCDPRGTVTMTCGATEKYKQGEAVTFPVIAGHRDANYTDCPGDAFQAKLPTLRLGVSKVLLGLTIDAFAANNPLVSPNGDGTLDAVHITGAISAKVAWTLTITNAGGKPVRRYAGTGASVSTTWDGTNEQKKTVKDGVYTLALAATPEQGDGDKRTLTVTVDTAAPRLKVASVGDAAFSPNADGWKDSCRLLYTPPEACSLRAVVTDAKGAERRLLKDWTAVAGGAAGTLEWRGYVDKQRTIVKAPEGAYQLRVSLRDAAGNTSATTYPLSVDRTLGFAAAKPGSVSPNADGAADTSSVRFSLTRKAVVTVLIVRDGKTVREIKAGLLGSGARSVAWDGRAANGKAAANGRYDATIRATSALGTADAVVSLIVDQYKPRLSAPGAVTVESGKAAEVAVTARDPFSPQVRPLCTVTDAAGRVITRIDLGWVASGLPAVASWQPTGPGTYALTFTATDLAGNREYGAVVTAVTVP